ncbi:cytochrome b [Acidipila sp. EB88]|uniref:cytochrome b n=1 Tax=Acidipila sp. EB88 TaxID=2305226 RepID=UPI000F5DBC8F|nr:cytochrome b [Acidipila sp. EB88]RRA49598.1 cytochrome b [Acidipila sp. EB88]
MTAPRRFAAPQRFLHWFMAVCILSMLFIGVGMVSTIAPRYLVLIQIHKPLGIAILVLALARLSLRFVYGAPSLPPDMPAPMRLAADLSQYLFYALMIAMPLIGWAMLSAASHPVLLFGNVHLVPILPVDAQEYAWLRRAHMCLGLAFYALILMHAAALLFHKFVRKDGVFETMAPILASRQTQEVEAKNL